MPPTKAEQKAIQDAAALFVLYMHTIRRSSFEKKDAACKTVTDLAGLAGDAADQFVSDLASSLATLPQEENALKGHVYNKILEKVGS